MCGICLVGVHVILLASHQTVVVYGDVPWWFAFPVERKPISSGWERLKAGDKKRSIGDHVTMSSLVNYGAMRLLVLGLLASLTVGQQPTAAVAAAWDSFRQEAPGQWLVGWHPPTGTPSKIYGQGLPLVDWRENTLEEARRHATQAMQRWPELLGVGQSDFREVIGARMGRTYTFSFAQSYRGLPVIGGGLEVRIHMRGRVCFLGSKAWDVPANFQTTPKIDLENATSIAWMSMERTPSQVQQPGAQRQPRLVIWGDANATELAPIHLAWEIPVSAIDQNGAGPVGRVYVDAISGGRLHYANDKHECGIAGCERRTDTPPAVYTVMGYVRTSPQANSTPTNVPLVGLEVDVPGHGTLITDQFGQFTVNLTSPTTVTVKLDGIHCRQVSGANPVDETLVLQPGVSQTFQIASSNSSNNEIAHPTTYYWVYQINELARSILGNSLELIVADQVMATVNITSTCNAYYVANSINFYQAGGSCTNTATASVVAHEWGHGLDDRYGGISQINGLSEGWGDICSIYLLDDPTIGHGFFNGGGGLRTGNNNRQYPSGGGPHSQGESWMGFAWKFRQNLRSSLGTSQAIAISNEVVLGSIAANASNQEDAVLQAFLADDDDGVLVNGTPHHAELSAACQTHNLPYPGIEAGFISHDNPLELTAKQLTPRLVTCKAVPTYGTFTQVRVHYDAGQALQRNMVVTGATDEYQAMLPGVLAPISTTYHFEAVHSSGAVFRLPETGEFSYLTQAELIVWSENFDSGAPGWTHGAVSGNDDWEIGQPGGYGGPGWSDPSNAASGVTCAGTDLTSNGMYSASSESWLRSPPIDCSNYTSLRLRLKRWISCDVQSQDRLEIRANNSLRWVNPSVLLHDSEWAVLTVNLPLAAGNPAVVLEFRIISNGSTQFGGWNIDDIEVFTVTSSVVLANQLRILPEQLPQGAPMQLSLQAAQAQPFLIVLGDQPGPTAVPDFPIIDVGGNLVLLFDVTNSSGQYALTFNAPPAVPLTGVAFYSQVLAIDPGVGFSTSNQCINLITQ